MSTTISKKCLKTVDEKVLKNSYRGIENLKNF
jgi:hypothetical protein